jgi:hypothetical protein
MPSVAFYFYYAECHCVKCRYAECRYTECRGVNTLSFFMVSLLGNIWLFWVGCLGQNTLAYLASSPVKKCFTKLTPGACATNLFTVVITSVS